MKGLIGSIVLAMSLASAACAQVSGINSVKLFPRDLFNDAPNSTLTITNNYPDEIIIDDQHVTAPSGFANRHIWKFSADDGATAYAFSNNDFFEVYMTITLSGQVTPRREAGFILDSIGGSGQFIVNTDAHEVVAFGGPFPFYRFADLSFNSGDTIVYGMTYFLDPQDNLRKIIYHANDQDSPALEFTNLEQGIIDGSTLGGYLQVNVSSDPDNFATGVYDNITIIPQS